MAPSHSIQTSNGDEDAAVPKKHTGFKVMRCSRANTEERHEGKREDRKQLKQQAEKLRLARQTITHQGKLSNLVAASAINKMFKLTTKQLKSQKPTKKPSEAAKVFATPTRPKEGSETEHAAETLRP